MTMNTIVDQANAAGLHRVSKDNGRTWKWGKPDRDGWPSANDGGWPWAEWCRDPARALAKLRRNASAGRNEDEVTNASRRPRLRHPKSEMKESRTSLMK